MKNTKLTSKGNSTQSISKQSKLNSKINTNPIDIQPISVDMRSEYNAIEQIEHRLKMLECEKNEIEQLYGLNEELIADTGSFKRKIDLFDTKLRKPVEYRQYIDQLPNVKNQTEYEQTAKSNYKPSDKYKESLKYEPNINDLREDKEFEAKFKPTKYFPPSILPTKEEALLDEVIEIMEAEYIEDNI